MTVILGLTGGIATGKSTVSDYFKELKIPVVDADVGSRAIVEPGTEGLKKIVEHFGEKILKLDGTLDRKKLGEIVFNDTEQLKKLDSILEKNIRKWILKQMNDYLKLTPSLIVLDIPLLYEKNYLSEVDLVMVIATSKETQLSRLMKRDQLTRKAAELRIASQFPIENKMEQANVVIDNNDSIFSTKRQVYAWLIENNFLEKV
ncbi:dephospho-CoA kinase [Carnobacterium sp.]|uniref:dephospho-CoA kinase n=1 Tax=Carnobacterium sp. TaxID=48221 RepID=UPI003C73A258